MTKRIRKVYPSRRIADGEPSIFVHAGGSHRKNKRIREVANPLDGFEYYGRAQYGSKKVAYRVTPEALPKAKELGFTLIRDHQTEFKGVLTFKWQFFTDRDDVPPMSNEGLGDFDLTQLPLTECIVSDAFFEMYPEFTELGDEEVYMFGHNFVAGYKHALAKIQVVDGKVYATSRDIRDWFNWASAYADNLDKLVW